MLYYLSNKSGKIKPFSGCLNKTKSEKILITKMDNKNICAHIIGTDYNYNLVFKVE